MDLRCAVSCSERLDGRKGGRIVIERIGKGKMGRKIQLKISEMTMKREGREWRKNGMVGICIKKLQTI